MHAVHIRSVVRITVSIAVRARRIVATSSRVRNIRYVPRVVLKFDHSLRFARKPAHRFRVPAQSARSRHLSRRNHRIVRNVRKARPLDVAGAVAAVAVAQAARKKAVVSARKAR
jgi:hypothetical protein